MTCGGVSIEGWNKKYKLINQKDLEKKIKLQDINFE